MPTLGSTEKVALAVMARFMRVVSMPRALPMRQARIIKTTQTTAMNATMAPQIRYMPPLLRLCNTVILCASFYSSATASTSTRASLGKALTSTQLRAGLLGKYWA